MTNTSSPDAIGSDAVAVQISPWVDTRPGVPGVIGARARAAVPSMPADPVAGRRRCEMSPSRASRTRIADSPATTGRITPRLTCSSGADVSISIIDPNSRLSTPPALRTPWLTTLISRTNSKTPNRISSTPA